MPSVRATDLHCTNVENILMAQNWLVLCLQELWKQPEVVEKMKSMAQSIPVGKMSLQTSKCSNDLDSLHCIIGKN